MDKHLRAFIATHSYLKNKIRKSKENCSYRHECLDVPCMNCGAMIGDSCKHLFAHLDSDSDVMCYARKYLYKDFMKMDNMSKLQVLAEWEMIYASVDK